MRVNLKNMLRERTQTHTARSMYMKLQVPKNAGARPDSGPGARIRALAPPAPVRLRGIALETHSREPAVANRKEASATNKPIRREQCGV